jgi:GT2 family glycosyltransferase
MERQPISIVIISYFKLHRLKVCIDSILPLVDLMIDDFCIVDNSHATWDGDLKQRTEMMDYFSNLNLPIKVITNPENRKFSYAVNQGIEATKNGFVFLINNDIEITNPNTFIELSNECCNRPTVASVTPVTVHSNGTVYCSGAFGHGAHKRDIPRKVRQTEWNNFSFVCLKRKVIEEIGLLATRKAHIAGRGNLNCRHFHSDEEWCRRASVAGYKHLVCPIQVSHYHKEG